MGGMGNGASKGKVVGGNTPRVRQINIPFNRYHLIDPNFVPFAPFLEFSGPFHENNTLKAMKKKGYNDFTCSPIKRGDKCIARNRFLRNLH